jgi:hypothetical protein
VLEPVLRLTLHAELLQRGRTVIALNEALLGQHEVLGEGQPSILRAFVTALVQGQKIANTSRQAVEQATENIVDGPQKGPIPRSSHP